MEIFYKKMTEALKLLSLNFNEQKEYFPEFVDIPFEILDTFEKAFMLLPQLLELNKINCEGVPNLLRLHNLINLELKNPDFETLEADKFCNSNEWDNIRRMAKETLKLIGEPFGKPDRNII